MGARQRQALECLRRSASQRWPGPYTPRWLIINESTTREVMRSLEKRGLVRRDGNDWVLEKTPQAPSRIRRRRSGAGGAFGA